MDQPLHPHQPDNPTKYWTRKDHYRFEDRVTGELKEVRESIDKNRVEIVELRNDVSKLTARVAYYIGAFTVVIIIIEKLWK